MRKLLRLRAFIGVYPVTFILGVGCGSAGSSMAGTGDAGIGGAGIGGSGTGGVGGIGSGGAGASGSGGQGTGGMRAQGCALMLGALDGNYLFALSLVTAGDKSNKNRPIVLLNTVTTSIKGSALQVSWSLQPLKWQDRKTPTGSALEYSFVLTGSAILDLPPLNVPADANPLSGSPITLDISNLTGASCSSGFHCGMHAGDITTPVKLSVDGSTWTMERIFDSAYPEPPKIDCDQNLALPLPLPPS